ncbi:MAG: hemerythrin domain-containing protein [Polyangiaceae bacterium]
MERTSTRRLFLTATVATATLVACHDDDKKEKDEDVSAIEDLMREHGVIRRVMVVYREAALRLRSNPASVPSEALLSSAKLMRTFAEEYHEKELEEAHIFPAVKKAGGAAANEIDTLIAQHQRGREITDYLLSISQKPIAASGASELANVLEGFARMYEEHTAREDTIVFQAWKRALPPRELTLMANLFEDIEHKTFGKDGFDDVVNQITAIEKTFGLDPTAFTAPPPPKA